MPPKDKITFDHYLIKVVISDLKDSRTTNFVFSNNESVDKIVREPRTTYDLKDLRRVVIWHFTSYGYIEGFQFFDRNNNLLAETSYKEYLKEPYQKQEIVIQEGERIVGI